jgi:heat-inducible transcriptional repressor
VITSTGAVTKRTVVFDEPADPGLVEWAAVYLNERVAGLRLGSHQLRQRFEDRELSPRERSFLAALRPAFTELFRAEQRLYVGGTASLLDDVRVDQIAAYRRLLEVLEQRVALLEILGDAVDPRRPFVRVGGELENPDLRGVALVGASYGLGHRSLGAVSLLGPLRMDYEKAIRSVRGAAQELSRFVEEVYGDS